MLSPHECSEAHNRCAAIADGLDRILLGQGPLTRLVLTGMLSGGHVLLEGLPGLGKTELVKGIGALCGLAMKRIQFTPDLLPADITGTGVLEEGPAGRRMVFKPGPIFAQIVLADEINRAGPKTQAALLEAMAERSVTVLGERHALDNPFFVLATQNPVELDGTYPLPEAQLDRFTIKARVTGVDEDTLTRIVLERHSGKTPSLEPVTNAAGLRDLIGWQQQIAMGEAVARYLARLINATRPELPGATQDIAQGLRFGASPRAALALAAAARAQALMSGRPAVGFEDIKRLAVPVLAHRLVLTYEAQLAGKTAVTLLEGLLAEIPEAV